MMPSRSAPRLLAACAATALLGCAADPVRAGAYPLRPGQHLSVTRAVTLTYDSFSDSRCPAGAQCIWAGRLVFRFIIDGPEGREEFSLGPDRPVATPAALHGASVALDIRALAPAPARVGAGPQAGAHSDAHSNDPMPVTLRLTPAGAADSLPSTSPPRP